jgi:predicted hydrocarbon binding protein
MEIRGMLSKTIEKKGGVRGFPRKWLSGIYLPSVLSVLVVFTLSLIAALFSYWFFSTLWQIFEFPNGFLEAFDLDSNFYQNLIAIHIGVGTILFALIIFVAQSIRDEDTERARVLLSVSYLFPITVAEIIQLIFFPFYTASHYALMPTILVALLTIFSLALIVKTQLNHYFFTQKKKDVIKARVKQSINLAIKERIGKNALFEVLRSGDIKLEYSFVDNEASNLVVIKAEKFGVIRDIDLDKLEKFSHLLDIEAQKNGYSYKDTEGTEIEATSNVEPKESFPKKFTPNSWRYIYKLFHDKVTEENNELIGFYSKLVADERMLQKLTRIGRGIFVIKPGDTFTEEIRHDLSGIKDQLSQAIEKRMLGKIDELSSLYIGLADSFLEILHDYGFSYNFDQAIKERQTIFSRWNQIDWLSGDIRDLIRLALKKQDIEILVELLRVPITISRRAIEKNDHYLFQEFFWFPELLYYSAPKIIDKETREYVFSRSWGYMKDLSEYFLESKLRNVHLEDSELTNLKDYAIHILYRIQTLLKAAIDSRDVAGFEEIKIVGLGLFRRFISEHPDRDSQIIQMELDRQGLSAQENSEIQKRLDKALFREKVQEEIQKRRKQMFFGIASYTFKILEQNKSDELLKKIFESISSVFSISLQDFTQVFLDSHKFETEDFWNWDRWEMISDGQFHSIDVFGKLERYYVVQSLRLLAGIPEQRTQDIQLPFNQDLVSLVDGGRDLKKFIKDIRDNPKNWEYILSPESLSKIDFFEYLLAQAKQAQEMLEEQQIRETPISQKKVSDFKKELVKEFDRTADLRSIFVHWKSIEQLEAENSTFQFGISQVDQKAAFFDSWPTYFLDWGENYGRALASGEDEKLISELSNRCEIITEPFEKVVDENSTDKNLLILIVNNSFELGIGRSDQFKPDWLPDARRLHVNGFSGWFMTNGHEIPVFEVYVRGDDSYALIIETKAMGLINQYKPPLTQTSPEPVNEMISISVQSFAEDRQLLEKFLNNPPPWLVEKGDRQAQEMYLRGRVLIDVFESFEYTNPVVLIGFRINLRPFK